MLFYRLTTPAAMLLYRHAPYRLFHGSRCVHGELRDVGVAHNVEWPTLALLLSLGRNSYEVNIDGTEIGTVPFIRDDLLTQVLRP